MRFSWNDPCIHEKVAALPPSGHQTRDAGVPFPPTAAAMPQPGLPWSEALARATRVKLPVDWRLQLPVKPAHTDFARVLRPFNRDAFFKLVRDWLVNYLANSPVDAALWLCDAGSVCEWVVVRHGASWGNALNAVKMMGMRARKLELPTVAYQPTDLKAMLTAPDACEGQKWTWMLFYSVRVKLCPKVHAMLEATAAQTCVCNGSEDLARRCQPCNARRLLQLISYVYSGYTTKKMAERNANRHQNKSRALAPATAKSSNRTHNEMYFLLMDKFNLRRTAPERHFGYDTCMASCQLAPIDMHSMFEDINLCENAVRYLRIELLDPSLKCEDCGYDMKSGVTRLCAPCEYCKHGLFDQRIEVEDTNVTPFITSHRVPGLSVDEQQLRLKHSIKRLLEKRAVRMHEWGEYKRKFKGLDMSGVVRGVTRDTNGSTGIHLTEGIGECPLTIDWPAVDRFGQLLRALQSKLKCEL